MGANDSPNPVTLDKSDSFLFGIFNGKINADHIFPYPHVFDQETLDDMQQFYSAAETAFIEENTPLENDLTGTVKPEHVELIKEFGMMGMQVPEEYEARVISFKVLLHFINLRKFRNKYIEDST